MIATADGNLKTLSINENMILSQHEIIDVVVWDLFDFDDKLSSI